MITMYQSLKGTQSYSKPEFDEWITDRNKAYVTFDYDKIVKCYKRHNIEPPKDTPDLWIQVARTVLKMNLACNCNAVREAKAVLAELNETEDKSLEC